MKYFKFIGDPEGYLKDLVTGGVYPQDYFLDTIGGSPIEDGDLGEWEEVQGTQEVEHYPSAIYTVIPFFEGTNDIDFVRVRSFKDSQQANQYSDSLTSIEYSYVIASELL